MPVIYFDTLKTSSLEGQATTVYAQGGKGNPRLVAWEGDRVVTFTMEDALISPQSFSILSGAGILDATEDDKIYVHATEQVEVREGKISLEKMPSNNTKGGMYVMIMDENGNIDNSKLPMHIPYTQIKQEMSVSEVLQAWAQEYNEAEDHKKLVEQGKMTAVTVPTVSDGNVVYVDYYVEAKEGVKQIDIEAGKFGGSYYLEASTLFRDQGTGEDYPAEFVIPNCKVQSNFTFTMAPTGDPSTFTFTMDAFPDYTKFDKTKKVIAALQIVEDNLTFGASVVDNG